MFVPDLTWRNDAQLCADVSNAVHERFADGPQTGRKRVARVPPARRFFVGCWQLFVALEAPFLRIGLVDGEGLATAICAGWFSGLTWPLVKRIPLTKPETDDWTIWLDLAEGCYRVNLNQITRNAAVAKGNLNYIPATKQFPRYLPVDVIRALRCLAVIRPEAATLGTVTDVVDVPEEYVIGQVADQVLKPSISRFYRTRSSASKHLKLSAPLTALAIGEFARVTHSRIYYHTTTPHQLDEALARVAALLGWGAIRSSDPLAQMIGACVVPRSETVAAIARELADRVLAAQPPKRYRWRHIRKFHNALADYVAFLVGLGILGRDRDAVKLTGSNWSSTTGLAGLHDKRSSSSKGDTPVAICKQVVDQLAFWFKHLKFLLVRMDRCGEKLTFLRNKIQAVLDGQSSDIVFRITERDQPVSIGTSQAYGSLPEDLKIKADGARHFWERFFSAEQVDDALADAQARRSVHWSNYWHSITRLSGARLRRGICTLQERVLDELGIRPVRGLVK